ncbi:MAG: hypothetical protein KBS47_05405 [Bacteroidales bacterium]|nr:hypothetical protein [Candidatus Equimonas enterica]
MKKYFTGIPCLLCLGLFFGYLGYIMGVANMMNTIMHTAHDLLLNTCFFLMAVCVITGALGQIMAKFGVVALAEKLLRPLMRPLFRLPGTASLGAVVTFLSDNPAIITLAHDKKFAAYFKKFQLVSLTNFGTAFGMGLIVIVFMIGQGFTTAPLVGLGGAFIGCIISTRLMQHFTIKAYPQYAVESACEQAEEESEDQRLTQEEEKKSGFMAFLDAILDGGKEGVNIGLAIIPGVIVISTVVMLLTFGTGKSGVYDGSAYQGVELLPWAAQKVSIVFEWLFGFTDPHVIAFPITALGAVGAAIGLIPEFVHQGFVNDNAIAVCTAMGMCWSGYLSTHTAMLDSLGYRHLTSKAIGAHTIGGLCAGITAHWLWVLVSMIG